MTYEEIKRSLTTTVSLLNRSKEEDERDMNREYDKGFYPGAVRLSGCIEGMEYALALINDILAQLDK